MTQSKSTKFRKALYVVALISTMLFSSMVSAAKPIYSGGKDRAAIKGYDPVAYFTENKPVKGVKEFTHDADGATWMFASAENRDLFIANPEKYKPQFGGYCAYAVSRNTTASIRPEFFTIHNDKLYLNFSKSVYKRWIKNKDKLIDDAEQNWPKVLSE